MAAKILYIHGIGRIGGAERDLEAMLGVLGRDRWDPHVACPPGTALFERLAAVGVPVHAISLSPWRKWYSPLMRWRNVRSLRAIVNKVMPALVHVNDIWWVPHAINAVRGNRVGRRHPIIAHVRQEIEPQKVRRYHLESVDGVIAISQQVEQALVAGGVSADAVRTIYSGLPLAPVARPAQRPSLAGLDCSSNVVLLGTVAHLFPRKGYDVMLRALPIVVREIPAVHYLIVGAGDAAYELELKTLARTLGMADHVHFVGFQENVAPFLSALSLYVHPARMEGFGIAVLEALAAGKAVVATKVGGVPEVVEHGRTGLLVSPDNPEELSAAILSLLRDERRRDAMGQRGAEVARERFDLRASIAAIERLYDETLNGSQARS